MTTKSDEKKENNINEKSKQSRRIKTGIVVSDKMDKTIVVKVNSLKKHPRYQKRYISSKKYKVHDQENEYKIGDKVSFEMSRPLSKGKQYIVIDK